MIEPGTSLRAELQSITIALVLRSNPDLLGFAGSNLITLSETIIHIVPSERVSRSTNPIYRCVFVDSNCCSHCLEKTRTALKPQGT